ncbi:hypothetical protein F5148DRAFT_1148760 [Russula earlei]|uniref:Uncharacterized protein n=1 Tax=Russula earlei TaxID=71964 RepID=A0ACC0UC73_9AGAM|nr:hypothetical protein F5148DRAFT_1148760 [Russula earlei]
MPALRSDLDRASRSVSHRCDRQYAAQTILTASTQLFAAPRGTPQFKTARAHIGVRLHAEEHRLGGQIHQATGITPVQGDRSGRAFAMNTGHLEETGRRRRVVRGRVEMESQKCTGSRFRPASSTEVSKLVGPTDRIAVEGGRKYLAVISRSSMSLLKDHRHSMHLVQGQLRSQAKPSYATGASNGLFTQSSFATKPCGLSNVLQRFEAPILDPCNSLMTRSKAEGMRRPTASKSNRNVTGSSRAQVGPRPRLPRIQYGGSVPKNDGVFSAANERGRMQRHGARNVETERHQDEMNRTKAICSCTIVYIRTPIEGQCDTNDAWIVVHIQSRRKKGQIEPKGVAEEAKTT